MLIRLSPRCLQLARVSIPAIGAEDANPEGILIPSLKALHQLAPARAKTPVYLYPVLFGPALQAQICHLVLALIRPLFTAGKR